MKYEFRKVTNEDVENFLTWKYDGVYSFLIMIFEYYNFNSNFMGNGYHVDFRF